MGRQPHLGMALEVGQDPGCVTHGHIQTGPEGNRELRDLLNRERGRGSCCGCEYTCVHMLLSGAEETGSNGNVPPCPSPSVLVLLSQVSSHQLQTCFLKSRFLPHPLCPWFIS